MAATVCRPSYQRLRQEVVFEDDDDRERKVAVWRSPRNWLVSRLKRVRLRRKFKVKIAGFRKFFKIRRRAKVPRLSWAKFTKRLKESQSHLGELFAGNYLFMQMAPGSYNNNNVNAKAFVGHQFSNYKLSGYPSRFSNFAIQKVA